jgi:hypothetical protein
MKKWSKIHSTKKGSRFHVNYTTDGEALQERPGTALIPSKACAGNDGAGNDEKADDLNIRGTILR